eukprot:TRINITY_DN3441_c0_g1_i1.p1 TRINITY_DN3441_c0_g1~~TRINITY_DN3441_c0_g1_i1.p1  ORF type:complete len:662 (-),score=104.22 TRINITY_DN3441_c0_g1_i1:173-2158(-)
MAELRDTVQVPDKVSEDQNLRSKLLGVPRVFHRRQLQAREDEPQATCSFINSQCKLQQETAQGEHQAPGSISELEHQFLDNLLGVHRVFHDRDLQLRANHESQQTAYPSANIAHQDLDTVLQPQQQRKEQQHDFQLEHKVTRNFHPLPSHRLESSAIARLSVKRQASNEYVARPNALGPDSTCHRFSGSSTHEQPLIVPRLDIGTLQAISQTDSYANVVQGHVRTDHQPNLNSTTPPEKMLNCQDSISCQLGSTTPRISLSKPGLPSGMNTIARAEKQHRFELNASGPLHAQQRHRSSASSRRGSMTTRLDLEATALLDQPGSHVEVRRRKSQDHFPDSESTFCMKEGMHERKPPRSRLGSTQRLELGSLRALSDEQATQPEPPSKKAARPYTKDQPRHRSSRSSSIESMRGCFREGQRWSKETFISLFDGFDAMDILNTGNVRRKDFMWALKALGSNLDFLKASHKARLSEYFHKTAEDLSVDGFIRLAFPVATAEECLQLRRWADLRKAYLFVTRRDFKAQDHELQKLFDLLRKSEDVDSLNLEDLTLAEVLTQEELDRVEPFDGYPKPLTFAKFRKLFRHVLDLKYARRDDSPEWRKIARKKFQAVAAKLEFRQRATTPGAALPPVAPISARALRSCQAEPVLDFSRSEADRVVKIPT